MQNLNIWKYSNFNKLTQIDQVKDSTLIHKIRQNIYGIYVDTMVLQESYFTFLIELQ